MRLSITESGIDEPAVTVSVGSDDECPDPARARGRRRRIRRLGNALLAISFGLVIYGAVVAIWEDPISGVYERWQQHELSAQLDEVFSSQRIARVGESGLLESGNVEAREGATAPSSFFPALAVLARRHEGHLSEGEPLGWLVIPKLHLAKVFVNGTRWRDDLSRGPGRYLRTSLPGSGKVIGIAGHRTTFGAPFRHIDRLEPGDQVIIRMSYGSFRYTVFSHEIVSGHDWSIVQPRGFETLVLSACHPLYSASHRWVVFARLREVTLLDETGVRVE